MSTTEKIAPTVEAIDEWRGRQKPGRTHITDDHFGVDIRTRSGSWRCVTSRVEHAGHVWYWTIRGEGSSNGGRETVIRADRIAQARGWHLPASTGRAA